MMLASLVAVSQTSIHSSSSTSASLDQRSVKLLEARSIPYLVPMKTRRDCEALCGQYKLSCSFRHQEKTCYILRCPTSYFLRFPWTLCV